MVSTHHLGLLRYQYPAQKFLLWAEDEILKFVLHHFIPFLLLWFACDSVISYVLVMLSYFVP